MLGGLSIVWIGNHPFSSRMPDSFSGRIMSRNLRMLRLCHGFTAMLDTRSAT